MTSNESEVEVTDCNVSGHFLRATYIGVDFVLTVLGNLLTVVVTRKVEEFSDSTKVLITSLALADLGVAFVAGTSLLAEIFREWILPHWTCVMSFMCFYIFTTVSVYMLIFMTSDRLVAVLRPLRYSTILTRRRSLFGVALVWVGCIAGALLTTFTHKIVYNKCAAICMTVDRNIQQSIASVVMFYLLPSTLILLMNLKLLLVAGHHVRNMRQVRVGLSVAKADRHLLRPAGVLRGKALGVTALATFAFAISWAAYQAKIIQSALAENTNGFSEGFEFLAVWMAMTNSWWNVIIYSIMNRCFRGHMKSVLSRLCPRSFNS